MRSSLCEAVLDHLIVLGQLQHQCFLCVRYRSQDLRLFCTMSIQLLIPCLNDLLERSLPEETEKEIITIINEDPQIKDPHNLRTRRIGNDFAIEVHIRLRPDMTVQEAHVVATGIENRLRAKYGLRTHVAVHVEPEKNE